MGHGLRNLAAKLRQVTVGFSCSFFFRPTDALFSSEPGGGQGNLVIHTVTQDCVFLSYLLCDAGFVVSSLLYVFS